MSWYYAENNERRGPLEDTAFEELVRNGTVKPETLVWREGMPNWLPYAQVSAAAGTGTTTGVMPGGAAGSVRCSSCGNVFPESDIITIAGRAVCATCKPRVLQQMVEGASMAGAAIDPAKLLAELRARGGYRIEIGSVLARAWATVKANFWPCFGTVLLIYLVLGVAGAIPCIGIIGACLVTGPAMGGLYWYLLKQLRGEPAVVGDAFNGFNKPHFGQLALAGTVQTLAIAVVMGVIIAPAAIFSGITAQPGQSDLPPAFIVAYLIALIAMMYLMLSWILAFAFIIDKRLGFWDAMELSRKLVNMKLGAWILLMIVLSLLNIAGVLVLCVGMFFVLPVFFCSIMIVYEDILSANSAAAA